MASNAERLRDLFDRFWNEGDWDAGRDLFAPDVEWIGVDQIGLDGDRHGGREISEFFRDWLEAWDEYSNDVEIHELTPDLLVSESHFRGRGRGSGIEFESELGQVWEFRDGKLVRQRMFRSYDEARCAAEALLTTDAG